MAEIRLEGIEKSFGTQTVLFPLDLTIREKEFFTLVGPSGCGKSTLLHLVAGLESPTHGKIYFDGKEVVSLTPRERDVAMVFQNYALYPHKTVYENIAFPLKVRRRPHAQIDPEVRRVASWLNLEELLQRRPSQLSGGQQQRVALGRALIRKPRVFLLDEPLSNLDAQLRTQMRAEIKKLHQKFPVTTVYVTHDQEEALTLSDRIGILQGGRLQQCGSPWEVYRKPADLFVAGFIGRPAMNFLPALWNAQARGLQIGKTLISLSLPAEPPQELTAGIRPEHIRICSEGEAPEASYPARVTLTEPLGAQIWVGLEWENQNLTAVAPPQFSAADGSAVRIQFHPDSFHLFDTLGGNRI